jgi:thiol-disulfide isomerase/thioredoxin
VQRFSPVRLLFCLPLLVACAAAPNTAETQAPVDGRGLVGANLDGAQQDLDREFAQGKWVTLVFWQDWCTSCLAEAPHVQVDSRVYRSRVSFYGVVSGADLTEHDMGLRTKIRELGLTYPQIRDRNGAWSERFHVSSTPTILVFSPDGNLRYRGNHLPEDWLGLMTE